MELEYKDRGNDLDGYNADKEKLADEMADIFFAMIRLAKHYNVDILDAHYKAIDDMNNTLTDKDA